MFLFFPENIAPTKLTAKQKKEYKLLRKEEKIMNDKITKLIKILDRMKRMQEEQIFYHL